MKRCFIALNLPAEIKSEFKKIQHNLKQENSSINITWVKPEIAHINLHFLGDLHEKGVNYLKEGLRPLEGNFGPILAVLTGVGAFPSQKNPRVLFLGVKHKNENNLIKLYQKTGDILRELKLPVDQRPFIAHITLGRVKDMRKNVQFTGEEMFTSARLDRDGADIEFEVKTFELMESVLTLDGPEYKVINSYPL